MTKEEMLERLVFSDGLIEAYSRPERERSESACDHWSGPVLLERIAYLRKLAHFGEGAACDTVREFPGYSMLLTVLVRSGDAVMDEEHGLTFIVLDGRAAMVTGGALEGSRKAAAGEVRGTAILGGSTREVRRGDVVHVAAGVPHQFLLSGDKGFGCLAMRVHEIREPQS